MMERPAVLELMVKLKLRGMRAAYDAVIALGPKRHHAPEQVVGQLLAAQLADVESRATAYRMGNARFPVMKTLGSSPGGLKFRRASLGASAARVWNTTRRLTNEKARQANWAG